MKAFTALYAALDETTSTNEKVNAMVRYLQAASAADAAWAVYFLSGRKPKQLVQAPKLCAWTIEAAGISNWLFDESYLAVGDLAETMALLIGDSQLRSESRAARPLHEWVEGYLLPLKNMDDTGRHIAVLQAWQAMDRRERYVWNKLLTSEFRIGVSQKLVVKALAAVSGQSETTIAHRMMGLWEPTAQFYKQLIASEGQESDVSRPYPFFLAYPISSKLNPAGSAAAITEDEVADHRLPFTDDELTAKLQGKLGDVRDWQAEWKWDGIRSQVIRRQGQTFVWSRGEELVTDRFPEVRAIGDALRDGTVIDGEIMPYKDGEMLPFAVLQKRIGRKTLGKKILSEAPVALIAYDLLELGGKDARGNDLRWRRAKLAQIASQVSLPQLILSPVVQAGSWQELIAIQRSSREHHAEGLMLKKQDSAYGVGRQVGGWWKWKIAPYTIDAVLIYAQPGHGRRASLYTDYTFGVWDAGHLVPFAKAYSGLIDEEIRRVDTFVRQNTVEKFGPVRTVRPALVFELAFEGLQHSSRHKSGVAVRFPRISRWRTDKPIEEADTLDTIRALLG